MPRDLGQASRADLCGHFAGETSEQVGPLVNYLIAAGQLSAPGDGAPDGNRDRRDTELATRRLAAAGRKDTEVSDRPRNAPTELAADTVFELPPVGKPAQAKPPTAKLAPEPLLEMEDIGDLAIKDEGVSDDSEARTEIQRPRPVVGPAPLSPAETGTLSMDAIALPETDRLTTAELRSDDDTHLKVGMDPAERATSKVPGKNLDSRRHADGAMRDTVNFYNQTQSLKSAMDQAALPPPNDGTVPLKGRPNEYPPLPSRRYQPPPPLPDEKDLLLNVEPFDADTGFRSDTGLRPPGNEDTAARKDTDRYPEDARHPPGMHKLSPETDTQKLEMQPMPALPHDEAAASESTFDATTILLPGSKTAKPAQVTQPLPPVGEVSEDFVPAPATGAGSRIVPEIVPVASAADRIIPEIVPATAKIEQPRNTEKVEKREQPESAGAKSDTRTEAAPLPMTVQELLPGRKVYDPKFSELVTKRHDSSRDETSALLEQAGTLALKLRRATEESRTDLISLSARRRATTPVEPAAAAGTEVGHSTRNITDDKAAEARPTQPVPMDEGVRLMSDMPTARAKRSRVPTQAIGDIVDAIENKLGGEGEPLSDLLRNASRRITKQKQFGTGGVGDDLPTSYLPDMPDDDGKDNDDGDVDHLVAASAALRAVIESEHEADRALGETPTQEVPVLPSSTRVVAETPLAKDLDRMWKEFSIRKTGVIPKEGLPQLPKRDAGRTQGGMWSTLAGIFAAFFVVGCVFVYVMMKFFGWSL